MPNKHNLFNTTVLNYKETCKFFPGNKNEMPVCVKKINDIEHGILEENHLVADRILIKFGEEANSDDFLEQMNDLFSEKDLFQLEQSKHGDYLLKFPYRREQPNFYEHVLDTAKKINPSARSLVLYQRSFTMRHFANTVSYIREKDNFSSTNIKANCIKLRLNSVVSTPYLFIQKLNHTFEKYNISVSFSLESESVDTSGEYTLFFDPPKHPTDFYLIMNTAREILGPHNVHPVKFTKEILDLVNERYNLLVRTDPIFKKSNLGLIDVFRNKCIHNRSIDKIEVTTRISGLHPIRKEEFFDKQGTKIRTEEMAANHISVNLKDTWIKPEAFTELLTKLLAKVYVVVPLTIKDRGRFFHIEFPYENPMVLPLIIYMAHIVEPKTRPEPDYLCYLASSAPNISSDVTHLKEDEAGALFSRFCP